MGTRKRVLDPRERKDRSKGSGKSGTPVSSMNGTSREGGNKRKQELGARRQRKFSEKWSVVLSPLVKGAKKRYRRKRGKTFGAEGKECV